MQRRLECMAALLKQPAISELLTKLGVTQKTMAPAQVFNETFADAKDSGAAMALAEGMITCGSSAAAVQQQYLRGFAAGALSYGETALLLRNAAGLPLVQ